MMLDNTTLIAPWLKDELAMRGIPTTEVLRWPDAQMMSAFLPKSAGVYGGSYRVVKRAASIPGVVSAQVIGQVIVIRIRIIGRQPLATSAS